jgi:hypothetical protein
MKNKLMKTITLLTLSLAMISSSFATETSCRDHFKNVLDNRTQAAGSAAQGVLFFSMAIFPIVLIPLPGIYYLVATPKPKSLIKLMDQAESCSGAKIQKFYRKYARQVQAPMSFNDFCQTIHNADVNGKLCSGNTNLPSKGTIIDWIELNN